ncbi:MAG TPA: TetR family transcriptional regulator [Acidimicrobiales bacterium]|nr:TetR family transcriptional regulator [Acidimicrobiales bacterium]
MGRPAQIDRTAVLSASLALADEQGLAAVTMQAVADRLGVTPMALYRHVKNKADLLDGVVESILLEVPLPAADDAWPDRLAALARGTRAAALRHPEVFPLLLQRAAVTPGARRTRDVVYAALREAGLAEDDVIQLERLLATAILGFAASEAGGRFAAHSAEQLDADFELLQSMLASAVLDAMAATPTSP